MSKAAQLLATSAIAQEAITKTATQGLTGVGVNGAAAMGRHHYYDDEERDLEQVARGALSDIRRARSDMRSCKDFDHDIAALKSCSTVYKAGLQAERDAIKELEDNIRYYKGSTMDLIAEILKQQKS